MSLISNSQASHARVDALPHGRAQPFYYVLPDVRDHGRSGGALQYIAQDNLLPMSLHPSTAVSSGTTSSSGSDGEPTQLPHLSSEQCFVLHPHLTDYFSEFVPSLGLFLPNRGLEEAYPRDAVAAVLLREHIRREGQQLGAAGRGVGAVEGGGSSRSSGSSESRGITVPLASISAVQLVGGSSLRSSNRGGSLGPSGEDGAAAKRVGMR